MLLLVAIAMWLGLNVGLAGAAVALVSRDHAVPTGSRAVRASSVSQLGRSL
jgi:hypothetical protein